METSEDTHVVWPVQENLGDRKKDAVRDREHKAPQDIEVVCARPRTRLVSIRTRSERRITYPWMLRENYPVLPH